MKYNYVFYTNYHGKLVVYNHYLLDDKKLFYGKYDMTSCREVRVARQLNRSLIVPSGVNKYLRVV